MNDAHLTFEIVNLIDNDIIRKVGRDVILYEFKRILPDALLRAAAAEYYCSKCNELFITKKEVHTHMNLMHKEDIEDPQAEQHTVDEEENRHVKVLRNTRLKRQIYRMLNTQEKILQFQRANRLKVNVYTEEHGDAEYDLTD